MIGRITGLLALKQPPSLLIDINGLGYEVEVSMNTFYRLPEQGAKVTLHTHFVVRDDAHLLYGFYDLSERALFRSLIKVNGVGPKLALTILSSISPDEFVQCVSDHDSLRLVRLPGVGKKTAERLVIEMRDRLKDWQHTGDFHVDNKPAMTTGSNIGKMPEQEAASALVALGYKPHEASKAIKRHANGELDSAELIRLALKDMAK